MSNLSVMRIPLILVVIATAPSIFERQGMADDETGPSSIRTAIDALLLQLDSPQLAERNQAEKRLLDLGPDVLSFLPPPELISGVAVRESVKRVRIQLERRAARESAQASRIQLVGEFTVAQLLKEISSQSRNKVELAEAAQAIFSQSLHVEFENQPFWDCLDQTCDRLKLDVVYNPQRSGLILQKRTDGEVNVESGLRNAVVQRTGPVRIAILSAEQRPIIGDSSNCLVRIAARVTLEPRLRPLFLHFAAIDLQALDSKRNLLEAWNSAASYELPVGDAGREVPMQLDYLLPLANDTPTIEVRGKFSIQLAAGTERIVFDQTAQSTGATRRRGGVTVRLREVKFEAQDSGVFDAAIGVAVTYDTGGPAFESHRTWIFHNAVYMENESRQRFDFHDYDTAQQSNGAVAVDYRWEKLPAPATRYHFVYEAPTLILDLPVNVKVENIPIVRPDQTKSELRKS